MEDAGKLVVTNSISICNKYHPSKPLWCDLPADHEGSHEAYLGYNIYESWDSIIEDVIVDSTKQMESDINFLINAISFLLDGKEPTEDLAEIISRYS